MNNTIKKQMFLMIAFVFCLSFSSTAFAMQDDVRGGRVTISKKSGVLDLDNLNWYACATRNTCIGVKCVAKIFGIPFLPELSDQVLAYASPLAGATNVIKGIRDRDLLTGLEGAVEVYCNIPKKPSTNK